MSVQLPILKNGKWEDKNLPLKSFSQLAPVYTPSGEKAYVVAECPKCKGNMSVLDQVSLGDDDSIFGMKVSYEHGFPNGVEKRHTCGCGRKFYTNMDIDALTGSVDKIQAYTYFIDIPILSRLIGKHIKRYMETMLIPSGEYPNTLDSKPKEVPQSEKDSKSNSTITQ